MMAFNLKIHLPHFLSPYFCFSGCVVDFYARLDIVYVYVEVQPAVILDASGFHLYAVGDQVVSLEQGFYPV